jgi:hypothetical protein
MENNRSCNFLFAEVREASDLEPLFIQNVKKIPNLFNTGFARIKYNFIQKTAKKAPDLSETGSADLKPGEWVEVLPIGEIALTLDSRGRHKGLYFMPEMEQFCGGKFKVFKKAQTIKLETTGELRKLRSPTLFLEGVYCNGEYQGGCDRACFHFWRAEWLKRIADS